MEAATPRDAGVEAAASLQGLSPVDDGWYVAHGVAPLSHTTHLTMCDGVLHFASPIGDVLVCQDVEAISDGWDGIHTTLLVPDHGRLREVLRTPSGVELSDPPAPTPSIVAISPVVGNDGLSVSMVEKPRSTCSEARPTIENVRAFGWPRGLVDRYARWIESVCEAAGAYRWVPNPGRFAKCS
jgi:hypothetical protein